MADKWIPWLYQYGVGGLIFFATITLAIRSRALRLADRADRRLLAVLLAGFFMFLAIHGLWIAVVR